MNNNNLTENYHIHFVGIGGISMSGLSLLLKCIGFTVSGSDITESKITKKLEENEIQVSIPHDAKNVQNANAVVYSLAIPTDNVEIQEAKRQNILILTRAELLGMLSSKFEKTIAISGCHGKSTTTAMLSNILLEANLSPTLHIGAEFPKIDGSALFGSSDLFITEACEYKRSFLSLSPYISAIMNIEFDHADYYKDVEDMFSAYSAFAEKTTGYVVTTPEIKEKLLNKNNVITCGLTSDCYYRAEKLCNLSGGFEFSFLRGDTCLGRIKLKTLGIHNLLNALFAGAMADVLNVDFQFIERGLSDFDGIARRLENRFDNDISVFSDYAHHPTEIAKLISSLKPQNRRIITVFQPHTYSRTLKLLDEFVKCFDGVDKLFLIDTYSAREPYSYQGSAEFLFDKMNRQDVSYVNDTAELFDDLDAQLESNDILLFVGAGDIDLICDKYIERMKLKPT
ncbi:MAG: UDP-N-acetylmuramate--L-alanine ligase [Clostridia bacterium]